ncbi:MAG TPA: hypothetical protein VLB46_16705 [Pyrinomonadaceae bacterium]|nr:hypothetical protein [Pyrinomonadaceae bacterium]
MSRRKMRDLAPALAALFIAIATLSISKNSTFGSWFQNSRKIVSSEAFSRPDREPVIITNIKVGDKPININTEFDADDEWIKELSFKAKNHSSKNVTYVGLELFFPDTSNTAPAMVRQLRFGQHPNKSNPQDGTLLLKPGDSLDVSLPTQYESLKKFLEVKQPVTTFKKMMIRVYLVFFEDGSKWDLGNYYVPDPSTPSGFRMVEPQQGNGPRN